MGMLDDYGIDTTEIEAPSYDIEDGMYEMTIGDVYVKEGSKNFPDRSWVIFEYLVGEEGKKASELFELPKDPENLTDAERTKLGYYVARLLDLGVAREQVNDIDREDLIGLTGTLVLYSSTGKGKNAGKVFQNVKNVKVSAASSEASQPAQKNEARQSSASNPFAK
jgi:hypothetical protein